MTRRLELAIASAAVLLAALSAASMLAWRYIFHFEPWDPGLPPLPGWEGLDAFYLYAWLPLIAVAALVSSAVACWRGFRFAPMLAALVCGLTAMLYLPFAASLGSRIDRIRGAVREPLPEVRALVVMVIATLALAAAWVLVTRLGHVRAATAGAALTVAATLNGVLLHLVWLLVAMPFTAGWWPADFSRTSQLVPFRRCRGAMVWRYQDGYPHLYGRIDDLWLRFEDPTNDRRLVEAVSLSGTWEAEYVWLRVYDVGLLRVRADDPAVTRCDSTARTERVAPARWHRIGALP